MNLPEETYHQSVVYCSQEEEWEVREAVKEYETLWKKNITNIKIINVL